MRDDRRCPSPEDIAALADGRLGARRRKQLAAHLDACPDCYDLFVDTVRFRTETEIDAENPGAMQFFPGPRRWPRVVAALVAAAALLLAVGVLLRQQWTRPGPSAGPKMSRTSPESPGRPAGVTPETHPTPSPEMAAAPRPASFYTAQLDRLTGTQPGGASGPSLAEPLAREEYGFVGAVSTARLPLRLGVHLMDLAVAGRAGDRTAVARLQSEVARLAAAAGVTGTRPDAAESIREIPGRLGKEDEVLCRLGYWAEGGRLAARARRVGYFDAVTARSFIHPARAANLSPGVVSALERISDRLTTGLHDESDWERLERDFTSLVLMF
jgi:hypothetical protein